MLGLSKTQVWSFRWTPAQSISTSISVWNKVFTPNKTIQDKMIALTYSNISLGNQWSAQLIQVGSPDGDDVSKALFFTKSLQDIFKTDIVWLVRRSDDKSTIVQTFLNQGETAIRQATITASNLQATISRQQTALGACQSSKEDADVRYNQWLSKDNASQVDAATKQASEANECIARQNTLITSNQWVLDRLTKAIASLTSYISLVRSNKSTIINYPDLINSNTPSEIIDLQQSLTSLKNS